MGHEHKHFYEPISFEMTPRTRGHRFDDDFRGLPKKGSRKSRKNTDLNFFRSGTGDRIITNMTKERPELSLLEKALVVKEAEVVVNLNSGDGVVGATIAALYPGSKVVLIDSNLSDIVVARRNTVLNSLNNTEVLAGVGIQDIQNTTGTRPNVVVYTPDH